MTSLVEGSYIRENKSGNLYASTVVGTKTEVKTAIDSVDKATESMFENVD